MERSQQKLSRVEVLGARVLELAQCPYRDEFDPELIAADREWTRARVEEALRKGDQKKAEYIRLRPWISY